MAGDLSTPPAAYSQEAYRQAYLSQVGPSPRAGAEDPPLEKLVTPEKRPLNSDIESPGEEAICH